MKLEKVQKYKKFDFVILIPVFHDELRIKNLKKEIDNYLEKKKFFVCFVDDSNDEKTYAQINSTFSENYYVLRRKKIESYSTRYSASLDGFKWIVDNVDTNFIVEIDSDLSHHPKDILKGINLLNTRNYDLVIASKYNKNSVVKNRKPLRIFISKTITIVCKIIFDSKIKDYSNTFRFYTKDLVTSFCKREVLFKSPIGHLHNLLYIVKNKYRITEIPTEYIETNQESTVKIKFLFRYLLEFLYCILINKFSLKKS